MKRLTFIVDVDFDPYFIALLPAININYHSKQFEFEFLFLGIYIYKKPEEPKE